MAVLNSCTAVHVRKKASCHSLNTYRTSLAMAIALATTGLTATGVAYGQASVVEEIVVTARFREENIQSTPIAITAISAADLEARSLENVEDIGLAIPNAFFRENVGNYGPTGTIGLRGITQNDFSYAFEPAVAVYIDDVYHGTLSGSDMDLLDLERLEVLRGPQGTLFGKNSIGGAIRLISKKPDGDNSGSVNLTYGKFNRVDVRATADFGIIDDKVFARIAGNSRQRDGYGKYLDFTCEMQARGTPQLAGLGDGISGYEDADNNPATAPTPIMVTPGSAADNDFSLPTQINAQGTGDCALGYYGGQESDAGRVMLRILATENLDINLAADYSQSNSEPGPQSLLTGQGGFFDNGYDANVITPAYGVPYTRDARFVTGDPYTNYATFADPLEGQVYDPISNTETHGFSGTANYRISDSMNAKGIVAYRTYTSKWSSDTDFNPFPVQQTDNIQEHEQVQAEFQISGALLANQALEWTAGAFYYDSESRAFNTTEFGAFDYSGLLTNFVANDIYTTENKSVFLHLDYQLTERLAVSGGVRYSRELKTNIFDHQPGTLPVIGPIPFRDTRTDWKISADYQLNDNMFLYAQAATGFRSAGFTPRIFTLGQLQGIPPEEVVTYEAGAKLEFWDRRITANSAVFFSKYDPRLIQVGGVSQCDSPLDPNPSPYFLQGGNCPAGTALAGGGGLPWFFYSNAPGSIEGFESEISLHPSDALAINLSVGYNKYDNDETDPTSSSYRHPSALLQPKWSVSGGVQYTFNLDGNSAIVPRLDWFYQGERTNGAVNQSNDCPDECIPDYNMFNARVSYENYANDLTIALSATNLFDEFYWQQLGAATTTTGAIPQGRTGVPSRPREWALSATKRFR